MLYIVLIASIAKGSGAFYVMFPELGALAYDVLRVPRGRWARAPLHLATTPALAGVIGILVTRSLPYGFLSVLITVAGALAVILSLRSPIAPAISAGLLPLVLGVKSWGYPPGILLGSVLLALLSTAWRRLYHDLPKGLREAMADEGLVDRATHPRPSALRLFTVLVFVALAAAFVRLTGLRFLLFPPLVVIAYEMLAYTAACPWAAKPSRLPVACFLTAAGGLSFRKLLGVGPAAASCSMAWGMLVLGVMDLHVPPALAVALLPMVMDSPTIAYPFAVGIGTLILTAWFLLVSVLDQNRTVVPSATGLQRSLE